MLLVPLARGCLAGPLVAPIVVSGQEPIGVDHRVAQLDEAAAPAGDLRVVGHDDEGRALLKQLGFPFKEN